jgi:hypothetical protein
VSLTTGPNPSITAAIRSIGEAQWTAIHYPEGAPRSSVESDGGERPRLPAVVAVGGSWRQPDPGVAGEGGSSLDKVGRSRTTGWKGPMSTPVIMLRRSVA